MFDLIRTAPPHSMHREVSVLAMWSITVTSISSSRRSNFRPSCPSIAAGAGMPCPFRGGPSEGLPYLFAIVAAACPNLPPARQSSPPVQVRHQSLNSSDLLTLANFAWGVVSFLIKP